VRARKQKLNVAGCPFISQIYDGYFHDDKVCLSTSSSSSSSPPPPPPPLPLPLPPEARFSLEYRFPLTL